MPDLTELEIAYFNYEHGGLLDAQDRFYSTGHSRDFTGLVRVAGDQGRWPHILVMGFSDRWTDLCASELRLYVTDMSVTLASDPNGHMADRAAAGSYIGCIAGPYRRPSTWTGSPRPGSPARR